MFAFCGVIGITIFSFALNRSEIYFHDFSLRLFFIYLLRNILTLAFSDDNDCAYSRTEWATCSYRSMGECTRNTSHRNKREKRSWAFNLPRSASSWLGERSGNYRAGSTASSASKAFKDSGHVACEYRQPPPYVDNSTSSNVEPRLTTHDPSARVHPPRCPHHLLLRDDIRIPPNSLRKLVWESGPGRLAGQVSSAFGSIG